MAAEKLDFATVDRLTYRYFEDKKWDSVIITGKKALRQDIDYYFLRVRMGIAYFEKKDYFPASTHLKKARQFNSEDPVIADYLYYAFLYSNRPEEAEVIAPSMSEEGKRNPMFKHGGGSREVLQEVHVEGGYTLSSNSNPKNLATLMEKDSIYGEQDLYGNSFYSNISAKIRISKGVGLKAAYNYLNFTKTKYIQYGRGEDQFQGISDTSWGKLYIYKFPWVIYDTSFSYHVSQHEGHIGASVMLPWGLKAMPAVHFIHVSYPVINSSYSFKRVNDTGYYTAFDNNYQTFPFDRLIYSYSRKDTSFNNWVVSLAITKDLDIFSIGLSGSWSNLNGKRQKQIGAVLTWFPLGNLDVYGTTAVTGFFQGKDKRLLLSQVIGVKITPRLWGEVNFYLGNYTNANIFNGSIVYNNSDIIDYRGGATLVYLLGEHLQLSLVYQYFRKESQQFYYIRTQDPVSHEINEIRQTKNNPYNTNTLIGGITWKL